MKQIIAILFLLSAIVSVNAQRIEIREIDKFTKSEVVETSTEFLYRKYLMGVGYSNMFSCCIRKVNGEYSMPATILMNDVVKYDERSGVIFLLSNDETITLTTEFIGVGAEAFGKAYLFHTAFRLTADDVNKLKNSNIVSIRVLYLGGYFDQDVKEKKQGLVANMLRLVDGEEL